MPDLNLTSFAETVARHPLCTGVEFINGEVLVRLQPIIEDEDGVPGEWDESSLDFCRWVDKRAKDFGLVYQDDVAYEGQPVMLYALS